MVMLSFSRLPTRSSSTPSLFSQASFIIGMMRPSRRAVIVSSTLFLTGNAMSVSSLSSSSSPSSSSSSIFTRGTVGYQKYLHVEGTSSSSSSSTSIKPPLLILPGTAQSIEIWEQHLPFLSKFQSNSSILICEPLGVGLSPLPDDADLSLASQAQTVKTTIETVLQNNDNTDNDGPPLDVVGFSLGGRIAMALACLYPEKVNRLHLTGVGLHRSVWATLQIEAWKDILDQSGSQQHNDDGNSNNNNNNNNNNNLRGFAWSALLGSYSPDFLVKQKDKLPLWIDGLCKCHTVNGLRRLVQETLKQDEGEEWSVEAMAHRLSSSRQQQQHGNSNFGRLCVGQEDPLAPVEQVQALAKVLNWPAPTIIAKSAHVPPIENPRAWRQDLQDFLNKNVNDSK